LIAIAALASGLVVLLLVAERLDSRVGVWLAKPSASAAIAALAVQQGALHTAYGRWILAGLLLSLAGDVLLIPKRGPTFLFGLLSFLAAHIVYAVAFVEHGVDAGVLLGAGVGVAAGGALALRWLGPHLRDVMRVAVPAYVLAIGAMLALGAATGVALIFAGAALFAFSDLAVARQRFVSQGFVNALWGLPLYFLGQGLLAASVALSGPPNIVLVMIDTLRPDHLGVYGYERDTSPNLDRLAREGVTFLRASAPSSWTKPSVGSLFTSKLPSEHGAVSFATRLDGSLPTLAGVLRQGGYRTLGVSGNFVHVTEHQGFARGFDAWKTLGMPLAEGEGDPLLYWADGKVHLRAPSASEVNEAVAELLPEPGGAPLFLYVHYMEPHAGYVPPDEFRERFVRPWRSSGPEPRFTSDEMWRIFKEGRALPPEARRRMIELYDAEIATVDAGLAQLLADLDARGHGRDAVIVVVSDHGEEFGEHGGWNHGLTLFEESLRVPLVLLDRRHPAGGVVRDEPVDLLDVPPTLIRLAGLQVPDTMRGRDLLGALEVRDLASELHSDPVFEAGPIRRPHRAALLRWPAKAIALREGGIERYDLDIDPGERDPKAGDDVLAADTRSLLEWLVAHQAESPEQELDDEDRARLRALGYVE
jgi:arylsulfatase A-like enzyme